VDARGIMHVIKSRACAAAALIRAAEVGLAEKPPIRTVAMPPLGSIARTPRANSFMPRAVVPAAIMPSVSRMKSLAAVTTSRGSAVAR
jgi:hypothetical protein